MSHLSNRAQSHKASWRLTPGLQGHCFVSDSSKKGAFNPEAQLCSDPCWLRSHRSSPPGSDGKSPALPTPHCCGMETLQDVGQHGISLLHLSKDTGFLETCFACKVARSLCQRLHPTLYLSAAGLLRCPVPSPAKLLWGWDLHLETASVKIRGSEHPSLCSAASWTPTVPLPLSDRQPEPTMEQANAGKVLITDSTALYKLTKKAESWGFFFAQGTKK